MRRTPYTDRSLRENDHRIRQSFEKNNPHSNKQDMNKFTNSITAYMPVKPHTRPYNLQPRLNKPFNKRPLSVNRTYSELKHRSTYISIQIRISKCHYSIRVIKTFGSALSNKQAKAEFSIGRIYPKERYIVGVLGNLSKRAKRQGGTGGRQADIATIIV